MQAQQIPAAAQLLSLSYRLACGRPYTQMGRFRKENEQERERFENGTILEGHDFSRAVKTPGMESRFSAGVRPGKRKQPLIFLQTSTYLALRLAVRIRLLIPLKRKSPRR